MGSTNYVETFIQVAEDCAVEEAERPPLSAHGPTVASLQYTLLSEHPYKRTSDDVIFEVYATRQEIAAGARPEARVNFFAKDQACLRSSPLGKRYGWGIHHDADGRVALVALGSEQYEVLAADSSLQQIRAMRSKRA